MKKKILAAILATSAVTLASCGGGGSSSDLSIFLYQENYIYSSDMVVFQKANEHAGITLKGILQKYESNYDSAYTLRGKNANLVVNDQDTIEATALNEGIFTDLTDLIKEHAPNLQKYLDENPTQKQWATASDGKIYGVPFYTDGQTAKAFFVRQDWVDKLAANNKLPQGVTKENLDNMTVVQFEALLTAFKNNKSLLTDADNIYPYFDKDNDFAISELASLWGATAEYYLDGQTVVYGAIQPEFRTAMENISRWYSNKLIEPNILNRSTEDKRVTLFAQNSGGATHDWIGTTYSFNDEVYAENLVEGFKVTCIAPPTRADNTKYEPTTRKQIGKVTAINSKTSEEDKIKLIKWIDYFFTATGKEQLNFGIEGEHFTKSGSTYTYTDKILNDKNTALANLYTIGAQMQTPGVQTFEYEEAWLSEDAKTAMSKCEPYLNQHYNDLIFPNIKPSKADYSSINTARSAIDNVYLEQINKWLKGTEKINDSTWANYVSKMKKAGTDKVVEILQTYVK